YVHGINLAQREWQANRVDEARRLLDACPPDLRHWEWHYLYRQCHAETLAIRGHVGAITALAVSPAGSAVAAASISHDSPVFKSDLKIWDAATGKLVQTLAGHQTSISGLDFNPDGTLLASIGCDFPPAGTGYSVRVWDLKTGKERHRVTVPKTVGRVAFSPDGTRLAIFVGSQIRFLDAGSGADLFTLSGHTGNVHTLAFSADGRR